MTEEFNNKTISIIMPLLNEIVRIQDNIDIWRMWVTMPSIELIFVDGGSTDGGPQILLDAGFRCIQSSSGRARQMNAGAHVACGRLLWFVHADTDIVSFKTQLQWHENSFNSCVNVKQYWGFFPVRITSTDTRIYDNCMLWIISQCINVRSRVTRLSTGDQCQFFSKEIFNELHGFPEQPLLEDVQMSKKARALSQPKVAPQNMVTSGRRWLTQGIWRTIFQMWHIRYQYWRGASAECLAREYRQVR